MRARKNRVVFTLIGVLLVAPITVSAKSASTPQRPERPPEIVGEGWDAKRNSSGKSSADRRTETFDKDASAAYTPRQIFHRLSGNLGAIVQDYREFDKRSKNLDRDLAAWYGYQMRQRFPATEIRQYGTAIGICDHAYEQVHNAVQKYRESEKLSGEAKLLARQTADTINLVVQDLLQQARTQAQTPPEASTPVIPLHGPEAFDYYIQQSPFLQEMQQRAGQNDEDPGRYFSDPNPRQAELDRARAQMNLAPDEWASPTVIKDVIQRALKNALQAYQTLGSDAPEIEEGFRVWKQLREYFHPEESKVCAPALEVLEQSFEVLKLAAAAYREGYQKRNTDPPRSRQKFQEAEAEEKRARALYEQAGKLFAEALKIYLDARRARLDRQQNEGWHERVFQELIKLEPKIAPVTFTLGATDLVLSDSRFDLDAQGRKIDWTPHRNAMHQALRDQVQKPAMSLLIKRNAAQNRGMKGVYPCTIKYIVRRDRRTGANGKAYWSYSIDSANITEPGTDPEWDQDVVRLIRNMKNLPPFPAGTVKAAVGKSVIIGPNHFEQLDAVTEEFYVLKQGN